jgi:DNA-directed RNA polymerase subunit beta'
VIDYGTLIKVLPSDSPRYARFKGEVFQTTAGRLLFNSVLPKDYPFINAEVGKKEISKITSDLIKRYGMKNTALTLGKIKDFGFKYATKSGVTWGIDNVTIPKEKEEIVKKTKERSNIIWSQYDEGLLTKDERRRKNIELWHSAKNELENLIPKTLDKQGSAYNMWISGARGSLGQFTQMAGMRGLIQNTAGETIETPVISCLKEGLTPIEYFTTTHGSRKGLADTALNTSKAGYLT